jgi:hypothetical protein
MDSFQFQDLIYRFQNNPDSELEIRLGRYMGNVFNNDLGSTVFNNVLSSFDQMVDSRVYSRSVIQYQISMFDDGTRELKEGGKIKTEEKKSLKKVDMRQAGMRIALSEEIQKPRRSPTSKARLLYVVNRTRTTFQFMYEGQEWFKIDMSRDTVLTNNMKKRLPLYQMEVEFMRQEDTDTTSLYVKKASELAYNIRNLMTDQWNAIGSFNSFFQKKRDTFNVFKPERMPKALQTADAIFLQHHVIFPKLDGVMYYMVITNQEIFIINDTSIKTLYKGSSSESNPVKQSILFGEWLPNQEFNAFDCLFDRGVDVRNQPLSNRLQSLDQIASHIKAPFFKLLERFFSPDVKERIQEAWKFTEGKYANRNDGMIFRDINLPFQNDHLLKWKPREHVTVDLLLKTMIKNESGVVSYKLFYRKGDRMIPFNENGYWNHTHVSSFTYGKPSMTLEDAQNLEGKIVEFLIPEYVQGGKLQLIPIRIREDKILPNAELTVKSTVEYSKSLVSNFESFVNMASYSVNIDNINDPENIRKLCAFHRDYLNDIDTNMFMENMAFYEYIYYKIFEKKLKDTPDTNILKTAKKIWLYFNSNNNSIV